MPDNSPEYDKRLVVLLTTGPLAGLHCIDGTVSQLKAYTGAAELPDFIPEVATVDGRHIAVGLVQFKHRFLLYKEVSGPQMQRYDKTFDPRQQ